MSVFSSRRIGFLVSIHISFVCLFLLSSFSGAQIRKSLAFGSLVPESPLSEFLFPFLSLLTQSVKTGAYINCVRFTRTRRDKSLLLLTIKQVCIQTVSVGGTTAAALFGCGSIY